MPIDVLGYIAAAFSTFAMLPQALHVWRTGQVEQLSLRAFGMATVGAILWLIYGIAISNGVIVTANLVGLFIVGYIATRKTLWLIRLQTRIIPKDPETRSGYKGQRPGTETSPTRSA